MSPDVLNLFYLAAAILFIFGIKGLTHPRTAVRGNMLSATGMLLAVVVTLIASDVMSWTWIIAGLAIGSIAGIVLAWRIQMTAMPQLVALFNGFGGVASFLVAGAVMHEVIVIQDAIITTESTIATAVSGIIGAVTFSGSLIAFGKLQGFDFLDKWTVPGQTFLNGAITIAAIVIATWFVIGSELPSPWLYWLIVIISLALGVAVTTPIGGADMPVVIALLNSYSGLAASATGFVISNTVLIVSGAIVGASGLILTAIMCKAMNRSLTNVLFGVMAEADDVASADDVYAGRVKSTTPDELAMLFDTARKVMIVPGYGMAVAQAQYAVRDLMNIVESCGAEVYFGVHPVAGRMPGHMNVLLAEADVPYDRLLDMEQSNAMMSQIDIAMVIGANDVVNPDARTNPSSPIAGMPIINVDQARTAVVVKRSLSPGFAGIPNPLFAADNCLMMFGDGKVAILELTQALKEA